ncbi:actin binding [Desmophyllum pertusum]|uniref:Actin binding n=1 Tax=Desmophyllum pertusum TaxID=174260 RepID=A0A9W9Y9T0_9CNID|nr:actin binding [Desmophyllum pertusum]
MASQRAEMLLSEILKCFRAPLNEDQALAVCYQSTKELIAIRKESFGALRRQKIGIELSTIEIRKDGSVFFGKIDESYTVQQESTVLFDLGSVVYECLDYGMEAFVERQLDEKLERLILDMTNCDQQGDEGISLHDNYYIELPTPRERLPSKQERNCSNKDEDIMRGDITLEAVLNRCASHLPKDIIDPGEHFRAVCRALVSEAVELSAFLHQLCNGRALVAQTWGRGVGPTNWAFLQSLQAAEWAQLWLQVMRELRQGVSLRHVDHAKLPSVSYELSPYEIILKDIRSKRHTLNHVNITSLVKKDAHDVILEFIRSRPPLTKASLRKSSQYPKKSPSPHDRLLNEIRSPPKLKPSPRPVLKSVREIYFEEKTGASFNEIYFTPPKRKCLKPAIKLTELINRWDSSSTVELDISPDLSRSGTPQVTIYDEEDGNDDNMLMSKPEEIFGNVRRASISSDSSFLSLDEEDCIKNRNFNSFEMGDIECDPVFPPSLDNLRTLAITSKIYMSLKEVKHMRRTLALLDLGALDPEDRLHKDLTNGRLCFCCQSRKFSLFGEWSRVCEICECKVCYSCTHLVESSSSHIFQEEVNMNQRDSGIADMSWPFVGYLNLGGESDEAKTHKICLACKRFIIMHC